MPRAAAEILPARGFLLVAAVVLAGGGAPASASDEDAATAHVRAVGDVGGDLLREFAALAEQGWPHWKAYFGAEPPSDRMPLRMDVRRDRDGFLEAVKRAGVTGNLPGAGGYYDPRTRVSFLYLQPHVSSTRLLVLHELTHQFQYKALQDDVPDRIPVWHREGLAEHFGHHRRTAAGLEVGALDVVAIDERPVECAKLVASPSFSAWAVATGAVASPDYTQSMSVVETLLRTKDTTLKRLYKSWEADVYRGGNAARKFEKSFTGMKDRLEAAAKEVWGGYRRTWRISYVAWDEKDGAIEGKGTPWGFLLGGAGVPAGHAAVEAEITLPPEATAAGLALAAKGPEDFLGVEVRAPNRVSIRRRRDRVWTDLASAETPAPLSAGPVRVRLSLRGVEAVVEVGGVPALRADLVKAGVPPTDLSGAAGLFADGGTVRFARVRVGD